jgi:uncharacterized protein YacL
MTIVLLILFFLTSFALTLYLSERLKSIKKEASDNPDKKTKLDKALLSILFGILAAALITSISMIFDYFFQFGEGTIISRVIPIGVALLLFKLGSYLIKNKILSFLN